MTPIRALCSLIAFILAQIPMVQSRSISLFAAYTTTMLADLRRTYVRSGHLKTFNSPNFQILNRHDIVIRFFVGRNGRKFLPAIHTENAQYDDIVMLNCSDYDGPADKSLYPLESATTVKVILAIQYALQHFTFKYFARVGDDTFFRFDAYLMRESLPVIKTITGYITRNTLPVCGGECAYPSGMGYIMTQDVASWFGQSRSFLHKTWPEDACVGAWVVGTTIKLLHDASFHDVFGLPHGNRCTDNDIMIHKPTPYQWLAISSKGVMSC
jgi:hypothetical protein